MRILILSLFVMLLCSCAGTEPEDRDDLALVLKPAGYKDLPGWERDAHHEALEAFAISCARILKRGAGEKFGPLGGIYGDWQIPCRALDKTPPEKAKAFFEHWFTPYEASFGDGEEEGLFTGYYEPLLRGSAVKTGPYKYPLYRRPEDLVMVDLGEFREELKGQRIAGRVKGAHLKPYEDRQTIEEGRWPHNDKALVWVDDAADVFFLHIQGSGRIEFPDGSSMRVGYDGQNGHVYYAIGRELVKRGIMDKDEVSLQSLRAWMDENPDKAEDLMNLNKSYVFFKALSEDGPLGGEGVVLTPERSLAIDRGKIPYGIPVWLVTESPAKNEPGIEKLVIAQDTGGAIRGAVRGDMFWGHGERAAWLAGQMKAKGRYWLLLPR